MKNFKKLTHHVVKQVGPDSDRVLRFIVTDETQDRDGDILRFDGWSLENFRKNPVGLYMHQYGQPPMAKAVAISMDPIGKRIIIDFKFASVEEMSSDPQYASEYAKLTDHVYNLYKNGYMSTVSVGFRSSNWEKNPDSDRYGRIYLAQELLEVSFCSVPANPNAYQTAKSKGLIDEATMDLLVEGESELQKQLEEEIKLLESNDESGSDQESDSELKQLKDIVESIKEMVLDLKDTISKSLKSGQEPEVDNMDIVEKSLVFIDDTVEESKFTIIED